MYKRQQLRLAARAGDVATMRALAHDVTSVAGNLEAADLCELARTAEASVVKWRGPEVAVELACELADHVDEFLEELQAHEARQGRSTAAAPPSRAPSRA